MKFFSITAPTYINSNACFINVIYSSDEIESELHVISNIEKMREINENLVWPSLLGTDPKAFIPEV